MSSKVKTPVNSLTQPEKTGWMTKQGAKFKTWKKRWFVLKGNRLYYFKGVNDTDVTGVIELTNTSFVRKEELKGKQFAFSVASPNRVYLMYSDTANEQDLWISEIQSTIAKIKKTSGDSGGGGIGQKKVEVVLNGISKSGILETNGSTASTIPAGSLSTPVRQKLQLARKKIPFLHKDSKVLEFWQIWVDGLPVPDELNGDIFYDIAISIDMEKLTWKTCGPQQLFIQRMVDFFWNVGAPESEIDHLNNIGAVINPTIIGSWIDMSVKGGMDGGWFFPVHIPLDHASQASDPGDTLSHLEHWAKRNNLSSCVLVGRDMGAAPPRQTEFRFCVPGTIGQQIETVVSAWDEFGFLPLPASALELLNTLVAPGSSGSGGADTMQRMEEEESKLVLSVVTSSEGIVRLGVQISEPESSWVAECFKVRGSTEMERVKEFEGSFGSGGPDFVEFQVLKTGFGYGVYNEGFDIMFHYKVGVE